MEALADLFGSFGTTVFRWAAVLFLVVNGLAAAAFFITRDRTLVNRWTSRLIGANLLLLGVGLGVPAVALCLKGVVKAVSAVQTTVVVVPEQ